MIESIKKFFTQYSREKILALIITFILWTFAINRNHDSRDYSVKINVITSKDQVLVSDNVENVQVKITGSVFDFALIKEKDLVLNINIATAKPGKFTKLLDAKMMPFSHNFNVVKIFPAELIFRTAKKSERIVSVDPWLEGQPAPGWKVTGYKVMPEKVKVSGPEKEIEEMDAVTTEKIILSTITETVEKELQVILPSPYISVVDKKTVKVRISIEKDLKTRTFSNVPVLLDSNEPAETTPAYLTVTLKGPKNILEKLSVEGFSVYVKNQPDKTVFKTKSFFLKDLSSEIELAELKKEIEIKVKKVGK